MIGYNRTEARGGGNPSFERDALGIRTKIQATRMNSVPGFTEVTPSPTLSTIPAPSWPRTAGRGEARLLLTT